MLLRGQETGFLPSDRAAAGHAAQSGCGRLAAEEPAWSKADAKDAKDPGFPGTGPTAHVTALRPAFLCSLGEIITSSAPCLLRVLVSGYSQP